MRKILSGTVKFIAKSLWVLLLVIICVFVVLVALVFMSKASGSDAASWTQAIGSIAAIISAIYIASRQSRHQLDLARKLADEKSIAQAARLYFVAKEYTDSVLSVVEKETVVVQTDNTISIAFIRMLNRLNSNFDDDLDVNRNEQIHVLRTQLTALIYVLDNSQFVDFEKRASVIEQLQVQAPKVKEACLNLLNLATLRTKRM